MRAQVTNDVLSLKKEGLESDLALGSHGHRFEG